MLFDDVPSTRTIAASLLLGIIYAGAGFGAVARYGSINEFLLPSMLAVVALRLPLLARTSASSRAGRAGCAGWPSLGLAALPWPAC